MTLKAHSSRRELFAHAFRDFLAAHVRGMQSLRARDFHALEHAIADESAAVDKASALIDDGLGASKPSGGSGPHDIDADHSLLAEHTRLLGEMHVLELEHRALQEGGDDLAGHREHRARLHAHIAELRAHVERLRARIPRTRRRRTTDFDR
jgi:hypothetical protein